ncbi:MAG TPA: signal peptide peptidase SppA [Gammaproteobacteria bacterium]|nr:signal peptide peptidase SppA [Gammaproteobacteria bacterium]
MSDRNFIVHIFGGAWRAWDLICRFAINIVVTILLIIFLVGVFASHKMVVPSSAALVVDPQGALVEQFSGDPVQRAINRLLGQKQRPQTRLRDVTAAIEKARTDNRIKALVLETDDMDGAGMADLQDIGRAILDFRKSGKPVFALGDSYSQAQYYLASMANTVFIHPQGQVFLRGFGIYQPYFKDALNKLGVDWNIFRVGKYKSAVEPFMLNGMSADARQDWGGVLNVLWSNYQSDVTKARKLKPDALADYISSISSNMEALKGDTAELALKAGLVDKIADNDQMEAAVSRVVGESHHSFRQIDFRNYLQATDDGVTTKDIGSREVGVIVAEGDIQNGDQPPGTIGGDSLSELIRKARYDNDVKALVLRVDSPGGSAFASDLILREIELTKEAGKPVIVSMGNVAASGGYWISMAGDKIFASPTTLTGSIGIFGMIPTFQNTLAKVGVHTDGVGTTPLSDAFDLTRPMSDQMKQLVQLNINHGYETFITKVGHYRNMKTDAVNDIAQGRVWSGQDALKIGLVDKFGDLQDAIKEAAKLGKLGSNYSVRYIEKPLSLTDRILINMANDSSTNLGSGLLSETNLEAMPWYGQLTKLADTMQAFTDPRGIYAYCFCDIR